MGNAEHLSTGSTVLHSGEIANVSLKFAEGYARIREVTDSDNACSAMDKAMFMACAAAARAPRRGRHWRLVGRRRSRTECACTRIVGPS